MYKTPLKSAKPFDCKLNTHLSKKHRISLALDIWSVNLIFTQQKGHNPKKDYVLKNRIIHQQAWQKSFYQPRSAKQMLPQPQ